MGHGATGVFLATLGIGLATAARADEVPDLYRQSYALEAKGDYDGAIRRMNEVASRGGTDYVAVIRTGWLQYLAGRHAESETSYLKAIRLAPDAVEPRLGITLPLMALRRWKEAERFCNEVLKAAPGESVAQGRMAYIQYMLGAYEKAEAWYRQVLAAYPGNVEMRAGLAWTLLMLHRFQEARAEFDKVLAVAPDHASAREGRAKIP